MDAKDFLTIIEDGIEHLSEAQQEKIFRPCAIKCVKDFVLNEMQRQFKECGNSLDAQYIKYGDTEYFHAEIIKPGFKYEIGYPRCLCPIVQEGFAQSAIHCECSRQSILFVLEQLVPDKKIKVETLHTVLSGAENCRFRVTVEE